MCCCLVAAPGTVHGPLSFMYAMKAARASRASAAGPRNVTDLLWYLLMTRCCQGPLEALSRAPSTVGTHLSDGAPTASAAMKSCNDRGVHIRGGSRSSHCCGAVRGLGAAVERCLFLLLRGIRTLEEDRAAVVASDAQTLPSSHQHS